MNSSLFLYSSPFLIAYILIDFQPEVIVRIDEGAFGIPIPPMPITVSPRMSITEVLEVAAVQFEEEAAPILTDINFYKVTLGFSRHPHCRIIREVGNLSANRSFVWALTINDHSGKVQFLVYMLYKKNKTERDWESVRL